MSLINLIRGGGDLASGVALRLHRAGLKVMITELAQPLVVRRLVSFAEAVYRGDFRVENVTARRVSDLLSALRVIEEGEIPVLIDPDCESLRTLQMRKEGPRTYSRLGPVRACRWTDDENIPGQRPGLSCPDHRPWTRVRRWQELPCGD
jgi:hypothetical protein